MATVLTQDAVFRFIQSSGGSVKNSDLLQHFRNFIRDHADQDRNRERFKKFVNAVATVRQEDGVKVVVLRRQFRGGGVAADPPQVPAGKVTAPSPQRSNLVPGAEKSRPKPQLWQTGSPAPAGGAARKAALPAAGIVTNNVQTPSSSHQPAGRSAAAQAPRPSTGTAQLQASGLSAAFGPLHGATPVGPAVRHEETREVVPVPPTHKGREVQPERGLHVSSDSEIAPRCVRYRPSYKSAMSCDEVEVELPVSQSSAGAAWPVSVPLRDPALPSAVSPSSSSSKKQAPKIFVQDAKTFVQDVDREMLASHGPERSTESGLEPASFPGASSIKSSHRPSPTPGPPQDVRCQPAGRGAAAQAERPSTGTTQLQASGLPANTVAFGPLHGATPLGPAVRHEETREVVPVPPTHKGREVQPERGLQVSSDSEIAPRCVRYRPSYKSAMSCDKEEEVEEELPVRQSSAGAAWPVSGPLRDAARTLSTSSPCSADPALPSAVSPSSSSSSSSKKQAPKIFVQDVDWEMLASHGPERSTESGLEPASFPGASSIKSSHRPSPTPAPPQDVRCQPAVQAAVEPAQELHQDQRVQLSSGLSISPLTSDASFSSSDWPPSDSSKQSGWNSSHKDPQAKPAAETGQQPQIEDLLQRARGTTLGSTASPWQQSAGGLSAAETGQVPQIQNLLQRAQGTKVEFVAHPADSNMTASAWHRSAGSLHDDQESAARVLCLSTGDLLDHRNELEPSVGYMSTPRLRQQVTDPTRLSLRVKSGICRSLGTELDRIDQEDVRGSEAARLNRLHLISSSLSLRCNLSSSSLSSCSTPPRCHSLAELDERPEQNAGKSRPVPSASSATASSSTNHQEPRVGHVRQSVERKWHVNAAAGAWPDIYSLFRDDPSLLNKQDFISGFSVLHWIAKHGDHRVLNTLWYGVQKAGLAFNVNARSLCGYTPLHIAAIHGSKNILRLLVKNFSADVKPRDLAGKRPWQYLSSTMTPDIFQLLGAPARAALQERSTLDQQPAPQRRQRRHHLSTASSGERPSIVAGLPKVKRSSSLAAFLKHKSLLPFHGQQSGTVI